MAYGFCKQSSPDRDNFGKGASAGIIAPEAAAHAAGRPVVLEFTSLDRLHGFSCPGLGIRTDIPPHKVTRLRFLPKQAGTFPFHCDNFCGSGHEGMTGTITVK